MLLPGHHYIGPGNPVPNGVPVDEDDRIALLHDIRYEHAGNKDDIRSADRQAIQLFYSDFAGHRNWHSLIGAVGIGLKYLGESVFGVQYPRRFGTTGRSEGDLLNEFKYLDKTGIKRVRESDDSAYGTQGTTQEDSNGGEEGNEQEGQEDDTMAEQQGQEPPAKKLKGDDAEKKKRTGGGGASDPLTTTIHSPINSFITGKIVFLHTRFMFSYGYQYKGLDAPFKTEDSKVQYLLCTPFARVPCHGLPFYMTKTEFQNLPIGSQGVKFNVTVQPLGFRTPFITNSAGINSVNSNLLVHGVHAHGLNNKYNGTNVEYTSTTSSPMIITEAKHRKDDGICITDYWGDIQKATDNGITFDNIPACFGNKKPFRTYYAQNVDKGDGLPTLPDIMTDLHVYTMVNGDDNPTINWEYRPQVCVLKTSEPYPHYRNYSGGKGSNFIYGTKVPFASAAQIKIKDDHVTQIMNTTIIVVAKKYKNETIFSYYS